MNESPFLLLGNMINTLKWRREEECLSMEREGTREYRGEVRAHAGIISHEPSCGLTAAQKGQKSSGNGFDGGTNYESSGHINVLQI